MITSESLAHGLPLAVAFTLGCLGFTLLVWHPKITESQLKIESIDPRQQVTQFILIAFVIADILTLITTFLNNGPIYLDLLITLTMLGLMMLNAKRPRLTRYILIGLILLAVGGFGLGRLFSSSGLIMIATLIVIAGLLLDVAEMLIFLALMIGIYTFFQQLLIVPGSPDFTDFDISAQVAFVFLAFIATITSSRLTQAFYHERALRKAQEQMLQTVCHELRTPVAAMRSFWAATQMEGMNVSMGDLEPLAQDVQRHTEYLYQLTEQVIQIVRGRQISQSKEWLDLAEISKRSVMQMEFLAKTMGMALVLQIEDVPLKIWGTNEWQTVFVNLIDNALRHSRGTQIEVNVRKENDATIIRVSDDGSGLPLKLPILAQPWVRYDQTSSKGISQGLGLGWTVIQDICQRNGARISVGKGIGGRGLGVAISFRSFSWLDRCIKMPIRDFLHKAFSSIPHSFPD